MASEAKAIPRFTLDPHEGTVTGPGGTVRLEPRVMEVLAVLSRHPGRVVSRSELLDIVWPGVVVTEQTLSRCIYQLRRDLGRVSGHQASAVFNPIETLPKRGYRLLAEFETHNVRDATIPSSQAISSQVIPFVVGQWVRGDRFYGRTAQIAEILEGHRNCIWLLGTRRIGKTSLLKQVEFIARTARKPRYFPVFWDFQGADSREELHLNFTDALLDAEEGLERIGIALEDVQADDLFLSLDRLRQRLRAKSVTLLLLCDEVEELINLQQADPSFLRKLRHAMQSHEDIRTVLASTIRLWALSEREEDTSPFLHGFTPPMYIARFSNEEARSLIEQTHLGPEERPYFEDGTVNFIREYCDNHPFLIQLLCKRYLESGSLEEALERVACDQMVSYFFSVDFGMLSAVEREIVRSITAQSELSGLSARDELAIGPGAIEGSLRRLEDLGYIRRKDASRFKLSNYFFQRWLTNLPASPGSTDNGKLPDSATAPAAPAAERDKERSTDGFFLEMKRRNVFRVGFAYVVAAWVLLQLGEILFEFLDVPAWAGKLLVVFLALGFPVALILAWAYELTPQGIKRDADVDRTQSAVGPARRKIDLVIMAVLAIAVILFALDRIA